MTKKKKLIIAGAIIGGIILTLLLGLLILGATICDTCNQSKIFQSGEVDCPDCINGHVDCSRCDGTGTSIYGRTCSGCSGLKHFRCSRCNGRGKIDCPDC